MDTAAVVIEDTMAPVIDLAPKTGLEDQTTVGLVRTVAAQINREYLGLIIAKAAAFVASE